MSGDNNEEEYLDELLKNAMSENGESDGDALDSGSEDETSDDSLNYADMEKTAALENFSTLKPQDDDSSDGQTDEDSFDEEAAIFQMFGNKSGDEDDGDAREENSSDYVPEEVLDDRIIDNLKGIVEGESEELKNETDGKDNNVSDGEDILALDDEGLSSDMASGDDNLSGSEADTSTGETPAGESSENPFDINGIPGEMNAADNPETVAETPEKKGKKEKNKKAKSKKEKNKKEKTEKKKFSFKNFFLEEENPEQETSESNQNQKLIDELYANTDSLSDASPDDIGSKGKKPRKEKKVKEKKPKEKKVKAPKPSKAPKAPKGSNEKLPVAAIARAVLIASVVAAIIIIGSRIFNYKNSMSSARQYFDEGNYARAYSILAGMELNEEDNEFYKKVETIMLVAQGLESYDSNMTVNNIPDALDSLIQAVGRKAKYAGSISQYEVEPQVQKVYDKILNILSEYGINEQQALDYYLMTSHNEYYDILNGYGGVPDDSGN